MPSTRSLDVLVAAARMYYEEGRSQRNVARALGISESAVSRTLAAARDAGVVRILIHDPRLEVDRSAHLEARLERTFGLAGAWVGTGAGELGPTEVVAKLGAQLFADRLWSMRRVGLSWGSTIARLVEVVEPQAAPTDLELLPLVGGSSALETAPSGTTSLYTLAQKLGVRARRIDAPAITESPETRAAILRESSIRGALESATTVDTAWAGIGSVGVSGGSSERLLAAMRLTSEERDVVRQENPAGDFCGRFFDDDGVPLTGPTSTRVIGVDFNDLQRIPTVVGLAGGIAKVRGVLAALRSGVIDVAVLDAELAAEVVRRAAKA
ncbi:MAG: transcriptional regulator [Actinobacteria bacterium HGW-Actinobacteria-5]|jgi:DNA-binding transcriptional regulator LsrR (DeoR family)|nr:MAG: transcriptional regulator [Actinobacteria bacterium HGW-Actinobacteria-5]